MAGAKAGEVVDLRPVGEAKTVAIVKTASFEAIRLVVKAGDQIAAHRVSGRITLHCLEGRVLLTLPGTSVEMGSGQWVYLDGGTEHSLQGIEDACLLLTIMFEG